MTCQGLALFPLFIVAPGPSPLCLIVSNVSQGHSQNPSRVEPCLTDCLIPSWANGASSPTTAPEGHCMVTGHCKEPFSRSISQSCPVVCAIRLRRSRILSLRSSRPSKERASCQSSLCCTGRDLGCLLGGTSPAWWD